MNIYALGDPLLARLPPKFRRDWVIGHSTRRIPYGYLETLETGRGGELWLADAIDRLAARPTAVVQSIEGLWMAAGDPLRQLKANIEMALRRDDMRDGLLEYLRSLEL